MNEKRALVVETSSPEETHAVGVALGRSLSPGQVLSLEGDLGAGKTTLVRGICEALGVVDEVTSPTYALRHDYVGEGGQRVLHVDCFRLTDPRELEELALEDARRDSAIVLVEWGDRGEASLGPETLRVHVSSAPGGPRALGASGGPGVAHGPGAPGALPGEDRRRIRVFVPPGVDLDSEEMSPEGP